MTHKYTQIFNRCIGCSLHFTIFTDYPEKWQKPKDVHCPECGNTYVCEMGRRVVEAHIGQYCSAFPPIAKLENT